MYPLIDKWNVDLPFAPIGNRQSKDAFAQPKTSSQLVVMAHIFLLALASISLGHQQAPQVPQPFIDREDIADLTRLALTPKLDGKIDTEEWDPFVQSNGMDTYFQWEPGKLYLAA